MNRLRSEGKLSLCISPVYRAEEIPFKLCFLNARSLHKHIEDVRRDLNYSSTDVNIFSETRFRHSDSDDMYEIHGYNLFRNDGTSTGTERPFGGTAVYSRINYYPGYPYCHYNTHGIEITVMRFLNLPHVGIIGVYRSPRIPLRQLCEAFSELLHQPSSHANIFIGDFNVNWCNETERAPLYNLFVRNNYRQLVSCCTTDSKTCIDHVYTNLPETQINLLILETYFSDHKGVCALVNSF